MVCIQCGSKTQVSNSRPQKRLNQVWRRRECTQCGAIFTTEEVAQFGGSWLVKTGDGKLVPFSRDKLFLSLYASCQHRSTALDDAAGLCGTITQKLGPKVYYGALSSKDIAAVAQVALNRFDAAASVHFRAFHQ